MFSINNIASTNLSSALPDHYGYISDAMNGVNYSYDNYSAIPFSITRWTHPIITNLDSTNPILEAPVSQQFILHHHSNLPQFQTPVMSTLQQTAQLNNLPLTSTNNSFDDSYMAFSAPISISSLPNNNKLLKNIKLYKNYPNKSVLTNVELRVINQPETHHRARYLTEGSRGTIKDRTGLYHPTIQLIGYNNSTVKLQCFIGHHENIGIPHMFYQASEVSGKTPYNFVQIDGINTIEIDLLPRDNMQAVVDCIGILKERNVDVERKVLRNQHTSSSTDLNNLNFNGELRMLHEINKSRSTQCRMVFRCILPDTGEILQAVSDPIQCTQPLGAPEILKMSLYGCNFKGGLEMFIIGKNFNKDSRVIFECQALHWRKVILPQKEFIKSTHLVCFVPPYDGLNIEHLSAINIDVLVYSNDKYSDPFKFSYTNAHHYNLPNNYFDASSSMSFNTAIVAAIDETEVPNHIETGSNANALFLLEHNDIPNNY